MAMSSKWEVKEEVKIDHFIEKVSENIGMNWKSLARRGLSFSETDIDAIHHDHYVHGLKEIIAKFFIEWRRHEGSNATPKALLDGLIRADLEETLQFLEREGMIHNKGYLSIETVRPLQESQAPLAQPKLIGSVETVHPLQESQAPPPRPKLIGSADSDVEIDKVKVKSHFKSKPVPSSPEDIEREKVRIKRLVKMESRQTGEGLFEKDDVVKVDRFGYGVVMWLGEIDGKIIAGIEFDSAVPGGNDGKFGSNHHFNCANGHGLYLPYNKLKRDDRFPTDSSTLQSNGAAENKEESSHLNNLSANSATIQNSSGTKTDPEELIKMVPGIDILDTPKSLEFYVPLDHAGLVIGKEGKNILEVERATNTIIKLEPDSAALGHKKKGTITGSEENCKKAALMILKKLKRRVYIHTAASRTISIPHNMVGRVIGKHGVTIESIKSLSGAHDIKFSEKPKGLEALMNPDRECTITGSDEEIEKAIKLIDQVVTGNDVTENARFVAAILKSEGIEFLSDDPNCVLL